MEYEGLVKWYDPNKAFGFISGAPDGDVFVHRSNIEPGRDELIDGQEVLFKTRKSTRGSEAYDVVVTKESANPPRPRTPRDDYAGNRGGSPGRFDGGGPARNGFGARRPAAAPPLGKVPKGPLTCSVVSIDQDGRFMFVRSEQDDYEIFVHGSMISSLGYAVHRGERVRVTVEQGPKGLRANSLEPAE